MIKSLSFFMFLLLCTEIIYSQKVYLDYHIYNSDNDSVKIHSKALSDKRILQKGESVFSKKKTGNINDAVLILDNLNRKFQKNVISDTSIFLRVLEEGYYNLYVMYKEKDKSYIISSPEDTFFISKTDIVDGKYYRTDNKYKGLLKYVAIDYPEIAKEAENVSYTHKNIQSYIHKLNDQHTEKENNQYAATSNNYFLQMGLKACYTSSYKNYLLDLVLIQYFTDFSMNTSIRFGLTASYFEEVMFCPEIWYVESISTYDYYSGFYTTFYDSTLLQIEHIDTYRQKFIGIPFIFNYEITNWYLTPYFYAGFIPMIYNSTHTRTNNAGDENSGIKLKANIRGGFGLKAKCTNNLNILGEIKFEPTSGISLVYGLEYCIRLK